jgi:2-polyprenyl-3-methyl-5-hydroxy-6-metoxy-1,4-benzoquinol methylase
MPLISGSRLSERVAARPRADPDSSAVPLLAAADYARFPGGRKKLTVLTRLVLDEFPTRPRVLDVGCGNGSISFPLAALGCEVVGADVDPASIESCIRHNTYERATFVLVTETLREVTGSFDLIVCSEVLEHLDEPRPLVAAMSDKLAPEGRLFVTIPNGYGLREIGGRCERLLRERWGLDNALRALRERLERFGMPSASAKYEMHTSNPEQGHVQKFTRNQMTRLLESEHLRIVEWRNSFVILSVFYCRSGLSAVERFDNWLADRLPAFCASGWYICCRHSTATDPPDLAA